MFNRLLRIILPSVTILLVLFNNANALETKQIVDHPLTDKLSVEVYDFVVDLLNKNELKNATRKEALEQNKEQEEILAAIRAGESLKDGLASAYEGQMSNILHVFCSQNRQCKSLSLYKRNGLLISYGTPRLDQDTESENINFIIPSDIYDKYENRELIKPQVYKHDRQFIYPIYKHINYVVHKKENPGDELIGFIVYELN